MTVETLVVRGIPVVVDNTRPDIATPDVLSRLDEALALIERYQPWRFRHLQRDLDAIHVVRFPCRGAWIGDVEFWVDTPSLNGTGTARLTPTRCP